MAEMAEEERKELPYSTEYAKSNRSKCKKCQQEIAKDSLRLSIRIKSPHFDGLMDTWYHFGCFWERIKNKIGEGDIRNFDNLKWEDQEKIRNKLADTHDEIADPTSYKVEYVKAGKAKCKHCSSIITKGEIRIRIKSSWYHEKCLVAEKTKYKIVGFENLSEEDQKEMETNLGVPKSDKKKRKGDAESNGAAPKKSKKETEENEKLKVQSKGLWAIRSKLQSEVRKNDWKELLTRNDQQVPSGGDDKLLDRLSDCMYFGALEKCPKCPEGQLVFSSSQQTYKCTGDLNACSAWTKCTHTNMDPPRKPFEIDEHFEENDYLKKFKFVSGRKRVFATNRVSLVSSESIPSNAVIMAPGLITGTSSDGKEKFTLFFGYSPIFSNFYQSPFILDDKHWRCTEQYYHYMKAKQFNDDQTMYRILQASTPHEQKKLGSKLKNFNHKVWSAVKADVMLRGVTAKFQQNAKARSELFKTIGTQLVEASPYDKIWGIGLGLRDPKAFDRELWRGENLLGEVLMTCRNNLALQPEHAKEIEMLKFKYQQNIVHMQ